MTKVKVNSTAGLIAHADEQAKRRRVADLTAPAPDLFADTIYARQFPVGANGTWFPRVDRWLQRSAAGRNEIAASSPGSRMPRFHGDEVQKEKRTSACRTAISARGEGLRVVGIST